LLIFAATFVPGFFAWSANASPFLVAALPDGSRLGLRDVAHAIRSPGADANGRAIYVFGEPALFFQLNAAGESLVRPVQSLPGSPATVEGKPIPTYLVAGPHANRDPQFNAAIAAAGERWELVRSYPHRPSAIVWLDLYDPRQPVPQDAAALDEVRLFRLKEQE
jgi:hypothetical protein